MNRLKQVPVRQPSEGEPRRARNHRVPTKWHDGLRILPMLPANARASSALAPALSRCACGAPGGLGAPVLGWVAGPALLCLLLLGCNPRAVAASVIERMMPANVIAGTAFVITNQVSAGDDVLVYAVEESVPPGWGVSEVSFFGAVDLQHGKIKWGPFFDNRARALTYRIRPPATARGNVLFSGTGSFNGGASTIQGAASVWVAAGDGSGGRNEVISRLPESFLPGGTLLLTNLVRLAADTVVYAVQDRVPTDWQPGAMNHGGHFDSSSHVIKWGPFFDRVERELICELKPASSSTGLVTLSGVASFDGEEVIIAGNRQTRPLLSTVVRELPPRFQANETVTITLTATPAPGTTVFALEETIPKGWTAGRIHQDGQMDPRLGVIKWGPFFADGLIRLAYEATAPGSITTGPATFSGLASFDGKAVAVGGQQHSIGIGSQILREMAAEFLSGTPFVVTNRVAPDATIETYAVEETVPSGWTVAEVSHEGRFDPAVGKIKWGPFLDREHRLLTFTLVTPEVLQGTATFKGRGSFNGFEVLIAGRQEARAVSPASLNAIVRSMPGSVRVGRFVGVTNRVAAAPGISVYAIEDQLPAGWAATNISHSGAFDAGQSKVKWGPFFDAESRLLTYQVGPPPAAVSGLADFGGIGSFDGHAVPITGTTTLLAIANHAPLAREDAFERLATEAITLSATNLLANDSDPDGDQLTVTEVSRTSERGIAIGFDNGQITYRLPAASEESDSFTYTVSDGFGGTATGLVKLLVLKPAAGRNQVSFETLPSGSVRIRFVGIPGRRYRIQATSNLEDPVWTTLVSRTASARGDFELEDLQAWQFPVRFYRTISP